MIEILYIPAADHAALLAMLDMRLVARRETYGPMGRPLKYPALGRAMTNKERARASYERRKANKQNRNVNAETD